MRTRALLLFCAIVSLSSILVAQDVQREVLIDQPSEQALVAQVAEQGSVPKLVKFSGALRDSGGQAITGNAKLTFAVYKSKDDESPLWTETRAVTLDGDGRYTVILGATKAEGIDASVFASGEGRYVGVQIEGQAEIARTLMVSVPYALKAGDSERLGGLSAGDFVLTHAAREKLAAAAGNVGSQQASSETFGAVSSAANTAGKIAKFTATDTLGDSLITENGSNIGIGTATPAEQLELTGNLRIPITTATTGIIFSGPNRLIHTFPFGSGNLFMGVNAGNLTTTSSNNLGVGNAALGGITTGSNNMALGGQAMSNLTTGVQNTAAGAQALFNNQANNNVAIGFNALVATTSGGGNTAVGTQAGQTNSSGTSNTLIGYASDVNTGTLTNATAIGANSRVNVSNAVILGNGANVGIGTSSPAFTTGGGAHVFNSSVAALRLQTSGSSYEMFSISNGNFGLYDTTGANYRLYITAAGNVGVNNTSPANALDVTGTVKASGGFKFNDNTVQTTALPASCASNQIPKWSGTAWACAADNAGGGSLAFPFDSGNQSTTSGAFKVTQTNAVDLSGQPNGPTFAFAQSSIPAAIVGSAANTNSNTAVGVVGFSTNVNSPAIVGWNGATGAVGQSTDAQGVIGQSDAIGGTGVEGTSNATTGSGRGGNFQSNSPNGTGVVGRNSAGGFAAQFDGKVSVNGQLTQSGGTVSLNSTLTVGQGTVTVNGTLSKSGGNFKIDHPLDPENKYMYHSFVESPDMMNIYNGIVRLNSKGEAWIVMPEWFEALNMDFRYQLTAIGRPAPRVYVSREIRGNKFKIAGGPANGKISWQVTGIRHDTWANENRIKVEVDKEPSMRGKLMYTPKNADGSAVGQH